MQAHPKATFHLQRELRARDPSFGGCEKLEDLWRELEWTTSPPGFVE